MIDITFQVQGIEEILQHTNNARLEQAIHSGMREVGREYVSQVQRRTPVKTGKLRSSIGLRSASASSVTVGTDTFYGKFVEEGTRPHIIMPVNRKVLRFTVGGSTVFARVVHHPGTQGHWMFRNTSDQETPRFTAMLQAEIMRAIG